MAGFKFDIFKGIRPRVSKRKLPLGEAQTAQNTKLGSLDLDSWRENAVEQAASDPYNNRTVFLYDNGGVPIWFEWSRFVDVSPGPIKGDEDERIYFTGDGVPKMTYRDLQTAPPYPTTAYDLGVPQPRTKLTATGQPLPEETESGERRTSTDPNQKPSTKTFEIVKAEFTTYPETTGTPNDTWRMLATVDNIVLKFSVGDVFEVLEVLDADSILIGSATGKGAVAATASNTTANTDYWHAMDEQGSDIAANFIGWRIPDGMQLVVLDHRLRKGDTIRVTRLDNDDGFTYLGSSTNDMFEVQGDDQAGGWGDPTLEAADNTYRHRNVRLGNNSAGSQIFELDGGFYFDLDRSFASSVTVEDRSYVYTFVSVIGEEGPPSSPSDIVQAVDGDAISLKGWDFAPIGNRNIDRVRLYRTNSTTIGVEYQFVREFTLSELLESNGEGVDQVIAANLGEIIETTTWFPPDPEMEGLTSMPNGMMVGYKGKNVYFCEPYQPHAYPPEYDQAIDYNIVGLAPFGNSVAVMTDGTPYVITGSHPRNANIRPYKINQACLYKESIAWANDKVYYASPDGLVEIGVNGARLVTENYVWKDEWADFDPSKMVGEFHDGKYFGFYGADNTIIPQPTGSVAVSGTLYDSGSGSTEGNIIAGGETIVLTLTDDTWVGAGSLFDAQRGAIIFSVLSDMSEANGWNNQRVNIPVTDVVRTSDTVVTITLSALTGYSISVPETLSFTAPASALAGSSSLQADERALIQSDADYATEAIVVTSGSTADNFPRILKANGYIDNWITQSGPADYPDTDDVYWTDAAGRRFSIGNPPGDVTRWVLVGYKNAGANAGQAVIATNENINDADTWVQRTLPTRAQTRQLNTVIYEPYTGYFFAGGEDRLFMYSPTGVGWFDGSMPTSFNNIDIRKFALSPNSDPPRMYAFMETGLNFARSQDLNLSVQNTWESWPIVLTGSGTAIVAAMTGNNRVIVAANDSPAEIGYFIAGANGYQNIGTLGMDVADMAYGQGRFVAISANGRIQYADAGGETTIGNWSAVSAAIDGAGTRDLAKIEYDGGHPDLNPGFGWIATLSASGVPGDCVVYTSPDAVTWTLQETLSATADALGIGVLWPEDELGTSLATGVALTDWSKAIFADNAPATLSLIFKADGTVRWRRDNGAELQLYADTDWIRPTYTADNTYFVRVTNVVIVDGSGFSAAAEVEDTWIDLGADRLWAVSAPEGENNEAVTFDVEISKPQGTVLATASYSLRATTIFNDLWFVG
jgi:hypothetical protein